MFFVLRTSSMDSSSRAPRSRDTRYRSVVWSGPKTCGAGACASNFIPARISAEASNSLDIRAPAYQLRPQIREIGEGIVARWFYSGEADYVRRSVSSSAHELLDVTGPKPHFLVMRSAHVDLREDVFETSILSLLIDVVHATADVEERGHLFYILINH